jgi:putative transferase (TIGR04331 family)
MNLTKINVRATALEEFWGDEYEDFKYLWEGAMHKRSLCDINLRKDKVCGNPFPDQKAIEAAHLFCKDYYLRVLPIFAKNLNEIHGLNFDSKTWGIALGYWLYRHISVIYDKYITLSKIDWENSSVKLLCESCYYVPENHSDYIMTFANDLGVQQLVSLYCRTFSKKNFPVVRKKFGSTSQDALSDAIDSSIARCYHAAEMARDDVEIALLGTYFSAGNNARLKSFTHGRINDMTLPKVTFTKKVNLDIRKGFYKGETANNFDLFFWESIKHCLPTAYLENFKPSFEAYSIDIFRRNFKYIASENWISDVQNSIYISIAQHYGKKFIAIEHATGAVFLENGMHFVDLKLADKFVTTGWGSDLPNVVKGGFMAKDMSLHQKDPDKLNILFVTFTRFIYWEEFNEENATNSWFLDRIKRISKFADLIPNNLKNNFLVRPRVGQGFWDVQNLLSLVDRNIRIDHGDYSKSIKSARIVVIDHMSTGLAEILLNRVPFILLYEINNIPLSADLKLIFDELLASNVLHTTPESAVEHLESCYSELESWWESERVQTAVRGLCDFYLLPPDRTINYLSNLLEVERRDKPNLFKQIVIFTFRALGFCLRALRAAISRVNLFST